MLASPPFVPDFHDRIAGGRFALGSWLTFTDAAVAEVMAGTGFEFFIVDGEHAPVGSAELLSVLIATRASGVPLLARVGANEPIRIMNALDLGASGVVVPQIRTVDDVKRAVDWCRYPPVGLRGIAPRRASEYGRRTQEYVAGANALVTCCIQVETADALRDLELLLAVPGVDCVLIGPNDLAASLGHRGDLGHQEVEAAIMRTLAVGQGAGIPIGVWTGSPAQARTRREQGFAFGTLGTDYGFMAAAAEAAVAAVNASD
jgi:2-keto-3-deoxy-L-rhamnonate aldolase RhmA